jgi:hypothetical protein
MPDKKTPPKMLSITQKSLKDLPEKRFSFSLRENQERQRLRELPFLHQMLEALL